MSQLILTLSLARTRTYASSINQKLSRLGIFGCVASPMTGVYIIQSSISFVLGFSFGAHPSIGGATCSCRFVISISFWFRFFYARVPSRKYKYVQWPPDLDVFFFATFLSSEIKYETCRPLSYPLINLFVFWRTFCSFIRSSKIFTRFVGWE